MSTKIFVGPDGATDQHGPPTNVPFMSLQVSRSTKKHSDGPPAGSPTRQAPLGLAAAAAPACESRMLVNQLSTELGTAFFLRLANASARVGLLAAFFVDRRGDAFFFDAFRFAMSAP